MGTRANKGFALIAALLLTAGQVGCGGEKEQQAAATDEEEEVRLPEGKRGVQADIPALGEVITELQVVDTEIGAGDVAERGQLLLVHYQGWIYNPDTADHKGHMFDRSKSRGKPFGFRLGAGRVIQGWDHGMLGMRVGGKRTLFVPADMAYGSRGSGAKIPPNASLMFEVELLEVRK